MAHHELAAMLVHYGAKFQGRAPPRAGALFPLALEEQAYLEAHVSSTLFRDTMVPNIE